MLQLANLLSGWALDEGFLADALGRASRAAMVSLDVFDTALTRTLDSPVDAFAETERRLSAALGGVAHGYAQAREDAERAVRLRKAGLQEGAEEVDHAAILRQLGSMMPGLAAHLTRVAEMEIAVERGALVAVPDILELTRRLAAAGKPFMFVSDMYLPAATIAGFLADAGYGGWQALHVSCESGATKASGRLWQVIRNAGGVRGAILHIGDDRHADMEAPRAHGIETVLYERARSERRVGGVLRPAVLAFSRSRRASVLRGRADPNAGAPEPASVWRGYGQQVGGLVLASFLGWLAARARLHRIERLYFCARDGWLIQRAWKAAGLDRETGIEDRYLYVSRRPLNLARGFLRSSAGRLDAELLGSLSNGNGQTTIGTALSRAGLSDVREILDDLREAGGSPDALLTWPEGEAAFRALLSRHSALVYGCLRQSHAEMAGYLRQEGFGAVARRCAIVDMGWHGSMQRSLRALVEAEQGPTPLVGFYYGLWPAASGNRYAAGVMESLFASDFLPGEHQPEMRQSVEILEELHAAPHGTVHSYREADGVWQPVFADNEGELQQYETVTRHFQDGALEAVAGLFATGSFGPVRLDEVTPDCARAALGAVCLSPNAQERSLFGGLGHCTTFDHARFERLIPTTCPRDEAEIAGLFRSSGWGVGALLTWYEAADAAGRVRLRDFAAGSLHVPPRVLRQFGL